MLHRSAIPVGLFEVLVELQAAAASYGFALAGGTSLALRFGHRASVDLDFFTAEPFDPEALASQLGFGPESITGMAEGSLQLRVDGIKVEFLRHAYPRLSAGDRIEGIEMWSLQDVVAMKLNAISNRGSKKDFYDVAALLEHFELAAMLDLYRAKYRPASLMMIVRSLAYFDDANTEPDPVSLRGDAWPEITARIASAIRSLE